jgi:thiamine-phosphate pyrophosphorylase
VYATPTKPGRAAVGLELVAEAAAQATVPWFAIGGIDAATAGAVRGAGARRIAVVRALTESEDPRAAAQALRAAITAVEAVGARA